MQISLGDETLTGNIMLMYKALSLPWKHVYKPQNHYNPCLNLSKHALETLWHVNEVQKIKSLP